MLLDPSLKLKHNLAIAYKQAEMKEMMERLNTVQAFQSIFATLWYGSLPCIDLISHLSGNPTDSSLLKYCEWKGISISCSAIFTTFPTDQGMCCSFNMKAADEIYVESMYRDFLQNMQNSDKLYSIVPSTVPTNYTEGLEPKTIPGRDKGLVVFLDAHSDQVSISPIL